MLEDKEVSRVAVTGQDADGHTTTVVAMKYPDRSWVLHVPTESRMVRLAPDAVAALTEAMSPQGHTAVVLGLVSNAGPVTFYHAPIDHGASSAIPPETLGAVETAIGRLRSALRLGRASR